MSPLRQTQTRQVLAALRAAGQPLHLRELGAATGLDHTTLHQILSELAKMGGVRRAENPDAGPMQAKRLQFVWALP